MSEVHAVTARPSSSIEEEGLALLISIEDRFKISVAEDNAPTHVFVWFVASHSLKPLQ